MSIEEYLKKFHELRETTPEASSHTRAVILRNKFWKEHAGKRILVQCSWKGQHRGKLKEAFFADDRSTIPSDIMYYPEFAGGITDKGFEHLDDIVSIEFLD